MNNLNVINQNGTLLVNSVEVAVMIGKKHMHLMRDIRGYLEVLEVNPNLDSRKYFIQSTYFTNQGKELPCYLLTKIGCDMVANKMTGTKGILFTAQYVETFDHMERTLKDQQLKLPKTYKEALLELVAKEEENERLQLEATKNKPLVAFATMCMESEDSLLVREVAKLCQNNGFNIGEKRLFAKLREWGLIFKHKNEPMQQYIDSKHFTLSQKVREIGGMKKVFVTMRVTPKGQTYILERLTKEKEVIRIEG